MVLGGDGYGIADTGRKRRQRRRKVDKEAEEEEGPRVGGFVDGPSLAAFKIAFMYKILFKDWG